MSSPPTPGLLGKLWAVGGSSFHPPKQGRSFTEKNRDEFFLHLHWESPATCGTSYFTVIFVNKSGNDPTTFRMGRWVQAGEEGDRSSFWPDGLMWRDSGGCGLSRNRWASSSSLGRRRTGIIPGISLSCSQTCAWPHSLFLRKFS